VSSPLTQAHSIISDDEKEKVTAIQTVHDRVKRLLAPIMIRRTRDTKKSDGYVNIFSGYVHLKSNFYFLLQVCNTGAPANRKRNYYSEVYRR